MTQSEIKTIVPSRGPALITALETKAAVIEDPVSALLLTAAAAELQMLEEILSLRTEIYYQDDRWEIVE